MRVAIYTAIFGSYDFLKRPAQQIGVDTDFYCFSDGAETGRFVNGWRYVHVPADLAQHPRMQAKRFKVLSHEIFPRGRLASRFSKSLFRPRYDASIWVDGSLGIKGVDFARTVGAMCEEDALLVYRHPDRDCVLEEAALSMTMEKYNDLPLQEQVDHYVSEGLTAHGGLYACGVIGRRCPESFAVQRFDKAWWAENARWTYQDQISFPHIAKRENVRIKTIPGNLWKNDFFDHSPHQSAK